MILLNLFSLFFVISCQSVGAQTLAFEEKVSKKISALIDEGYILTTYNIRSVSINDWQDFDSTLSKEKKYEFVLMSEVSIVVEVPQLEAQNNNTITTKYEPSMEVQFSIETRSSFRFKLINMDDHQLQKHKVIILSVIKTE